MSERLNKIIPGLADNLIAISLVLLTIAGPLRVVFALGYTIYFSAIAVLILFAILKLFQAPKLNQNIALYLLFTWLFFIWLIFSISWSSSNASWKTDLFMIINLLLIMTLTGYLAKKSIIEHYLIYLIIDAFIISVFVLKETGISLIISGYEPKLKGDYLTLSLPLGLALSISVFHFINSSNIKRLIWFFLSAFFMVGLGHGLSRGSLVFSFFTILSLSFMSLISHQANLYKKIKEYGKHIFTLVLILGGLLFIALNVERTAFRLKRMIDIPRELTEGQRGRIWSNAWHHISEAPIFGHGLGMNSEIGEGYPHNLFLQVWVDGGIIAVMLLILILIFPILLFLKKFKIHYNDSNYLSMFSIIVILTLEFSKSFDFYRARSLIICLVLGICFVVSTGKKISVNNIKQK